MANLTKELVELNQGINALQEFAGANLDVDREALYQIENLQEQIADAVAGTREITRDLINEMQAQLNSLQHEVAKAIIVHGTLQSKALKSAAGDIEDGLIVSSVFKMIGSGILSAGLVVAASRLAQAIEKSKDEPPPLRRRRRKRARLAQAIEKSKDEPDGKK